jgi:hypothetical protein
LVAKRSSGHRVLQVFLELNPQVIDYKICLLLEAEEANTHMNTNSRFHESDESDLCGLWSKDLLVVE